MIQSDKCLIDAVNRYKEGRTERTTSTKAQKGEALKRPVVGIRVHPARTATGEFIRHMNAAIETVQGVPLNLHMFSFDAELDNVTKQNKGGDWKDREIMELKAFHNEEGRRLEGPRNHGAQSVPQRGRRPDVCQSGELHGYVQHLLELHLYGYALRPAPQGESA